MSKTLMARLLEIYPGKAKIPVAVIKFVAFAEEYLKKNKPTAVGGSHVRLLDGELVTLAETMPEPQLGDSTISISEMNLANTDRYVDNRQRGVQVDYVNQKTAVDFKQDKKAAWPGLRN